MRIRTFLVFAGIVLIVHTANSLNNYNSGDVMALGLAAVGALLLRNAGLEVDITRCGKRRCPDADEEKERLLKWICRNRFQPDPSECDVSESEEPDYVSDCVFCANVDNAKDCNDKVVCRWEDVMCLNIVEHCSTTT